MAPSYDRKFVFLSPEDKGYELAPGKKPKGHIDIEKRKDKLNVKVFLENLKEMNYQIQLFTPEGKYVALEQVQIGKDGKVDKKISLSSSNLMNSGIDWENFAGFVIKPEDSKFKIALSAWIRSRQGKLPFPISDKAEDVKDKEEIPEGKKVEEVSLKEEEKEKTNVAKEILQEKAEDHETTEEQFEIKEKIQDEIEQAQDLDKIKEEEYQELEKDQEEVQEMQEIHQELSPQFGSLKEEDKVEGLEVIDEIVDLKDIEESGQIENIIIDEKYHVEEYWVDLDQTLEKEITYESAKEQTPLESPYYYINQNVKEIEKNISVCHPFSPPLKGHKWLKITGEEKDLEKFYLFFNGSFVHLTFPYMNYKNVGALYREKYKDGLFGMVYEEKEKQEFLKYYVYGIPGRFCLQEQPYQGRTGFLYWHPVDHKSRGRGDMGYWLLYIDAHTGIIAIPRRPTIPPVCKDLNID